MLEERLKEVDQLYREFLQSRGFSKGMIALIGGGCVIAHGIERTTEDLDFLIYAEPYERLFPEFTQFLRERFADLKAHAASKDPADPVRHDVILLEGLPIKVDFLICAYRWEIEGLQQATQTPPFVEGTEIRLFPKPHLIALKLLAAGPQDRADVARLFALLSEEEVAEVHSLAKRIKREKLLKEVIGKTPTDLPPVPEPDL